MSKTTLDNFIPDRCNYCNKTNIPHKIHWRYCQECKKYTYFNFQNWKTEQDPQQTSCRICGQLGEIC